MQRKILLLIAPVAVVLTVAAIAGPSPVGAPWISVELPANPLDEATRGAAFVVRAYYHEMPARFPINGTAEGLVDGKRQTIPLEFVETQRTGVYAVQQVWPTEGYWLLSMTVAESGPSLVVELGANGGVTQGTYYARPSTSLALRSVRVVTSPLNDDEVERALSTLAMK